MLIITRTEKEPINYCPSIARGVVMVAEIDSLKAAATTVLHDIAKHATVLATGLQNAAPPQDSGPGKSVLYLNEIAAVLEDMCRTIDSSPPPHKRG